MWENKIEFPIRCEICGLELPWDATLDEGINVGLCNNSCDCGEHLDENYRCPNEDCEFQAEKDKELEEE